eukprot:360465-Chlamydomonas_euryale.AAC.9
MRDADAPASVCNGDGDDGAIGVPLAWGPSVAWCCAPRLLPTGVTRPPSVPRTPAPVLPPEPFADPPPPPPPLMLPLPQLDCAERLSRGTLALAAPGCCFRNAFASVSWTMESLPRRIVASSVGTSASALASAAVDSSVAAAAGACPLSRASVASSPHSPSAPPPQPLPSAPPVHSTSARCADSCGASGAPLLRRWPALPRRGAAAVAAGAAARATGAAAASPPAKAAFSPVHCVKGDSRGAGETPSRIEPLAMPAIDAGDGEGDDVLRLARASADAVAAAAAADAAAADATGEPRWIGFEGMRLPPGDTPPTVTASLLMAAETTRKAQPACTTAAAALTVAWIRARGRGRVGSVRVGSGRAGLRAAVRCARGSALAVGAVRICRASILVCPHLPSSAPNTRPVRQSGTIADRPRARLLARSQDVERENNNEMAVHFSICKLSFRTGFKLGLLHDPHLALIDANSLAGDPAHLGHG